MKLLLISFALCFSLSFGALCIEFPKGASKGSSCGSQGCLPGLYCDKTATCSPRLISQEACNPELNPCDFGTVCKGPENSEKCIKFANPGEDCSNDDSDSIATCGMGLSCSVGKCVNGGLGDKCLGNADCSSQICTNSICSPPGLNETCSAGSSNSCGKDAYCQFIDFFLGYRCSPRVAAGAVCTAGSMCPLGHYCSRKKIDDVEQVCIPNRSVEVGEYCGSEDNLCKSSICNTFCAQAPPKVCNIFGGCGENHLCVCGSRPLIDGSGVCSSYKCTKPGESLSSCLLEKCNIYASFVESFELAPLFTYTGSCGSMNCKPQYDDVYACLADSYAIDISDL